MKTANTSFLGSDKLNKYIDKDKKYNTTAAPTTISRFGPSGSLKNTNITLENTSDVTPRIINEVFFDFKFIFLLYQTCEVGDLESHCSAHPPDSFSYF